MKDILKKLKSENNTLLGRINRLDTFINTDEAYKAMKFYDKLLMRKQLRHMLAYQDILMKRIHRIEMILKSEGNAQNK